MAFSEAGNTSFMVTGEKGDIGIQRHLLSGFAQVSP